MFLIAIFFTALGTAIASKLEDMQAFPLIMNFLIMPIFFLSGALFPVNTLPNSIQLVIKINPLYYGIEGLRYSLTGTNSLGLVLDFSVLASLVIIVTIIGSYLFSKIEA